MAPKFEKCEHMFHVTVPKNNFEVQSDTGTLILKMGDCDFQKGYCSEMPDLSNHKVSKINMLEINAILVRRYMLEYLLMSFAASFGTENGTSWLT